MRDELQRHVDVDRIALGQLARDLQHPLAVEGHPRGAVGLLERAASRQRRRAIEDADVVQPEEPALEQVAIVGVLAVDPPGEVRQQPLEHPGQELAVAFASDLGLALVDEQRGPGGHRRVDVAEVPLVRGDLPVRVEVVGAEQELDLLLREVDVDQRQRRAVEGEVPRGEPRVLPLVGHRDDVARDHVEPRDVSGRAGGSVRVPGVRAVLAQPAVDVVLVVLLAPEQSGERLAHDARPVGVEARRDDRRVEGVGLLAPRVHDALEVGAEQVGRGGRVGRAQADADRRAAAGRDLQRVVGGDLAAGLRRVHRAGGAADDVVVDRVLGERGDVRRAEEPLAVRVVVAEEQRRRRVGEQQPVTQIGVGGARVAGSGSRDRRLRRVVAPRPGVAEPERGEEVQRRCVRAAVVRGDEHRDVVVAGLRVLDDHVEVAVLVEDAGVQELVLHLLLAAAPVRGDELRVREGPLRILVLDFQVGMRRRAVEVEPVLLDVLAVVALGVGEAEHPLLQDRVGAVPQRERKAEALALVAYPCDPVLAPAVGARPSLVVREVAPRVAVLAVVLADGAPLALAQVRAPGLPGDRAGPRLLEAAMLGRLHGRGVSPPLGVRANSS